MGFNQGKKSLILQYTNLDIHSIRELTEQYDIGEVMSYNVLSGGSENTNYLIVSTNEKYVLTVCEQKSITEAIQLTKLLEHLAVNDFSTSKIIRTKKNEPFLTYSGKPIILRSYLEGEILKDMPIHLLELIGTQLGSLHQIEAPEYIPKKLNYGIEAFDEISTFAENSSFDKWLKEIKAHITPYISEAIPQALIHSDVFYSNIIIENDRNKVSIVDFEEASNYYRIFDVGMTIVGLCSESETINVGKVSSLLKGYVQEVELIEIEQNTLQVFTLYAAAAMSFWRYKNFNYTRPTPTMKDHYLELKNIADYIHRLPKDCFKKILEDYL